jgi:hypothetical protein
MADIEALCGREAPDVVAKATLTTDPVLQGMECRRCIRAAVSQHILWCDITCARTTYGTLIHYRRKKPRA